MRKYIHSVTGFLTFYVLAMAIVVVALAYTGCASSSGPRQEQTGWGTVRSVKWGSTHEYGGLVHETDDGHIKQLYPLCDNMVPVWQGAHVNILFHWEDPFANLGCYRIDAAVRR